MTSDEFSVQSTPRLVGAADPNPTPIIAAAKFGGNAESPTLIDEFLSRRGCSCVQSSLPLPAINSLGLQAFPFAPNIQLPQIRSGRYLGQRSEMYLMLTDGFRMNVF
eukprot:m.231696 g.231696  ORF g.231696 m.231696 type:complete len:107 (-) comp54278_c5_seq6:1537-1857(-)